MTQSNDPESTSEIKESNAAHTALIDKLNDAAIPGFQAEFDPDEADEAGAFIEDALSEEDAIDSDVDLIELSIVFLFPRKAKNGEDLS